MISELFIYGRTDSLFSQVVAQIPPAGLMRYHVSPDYGHDLNASNLKVFLEDIKPKYPLCVCITPRSTQEMINGYRWERLIFSIYFLERHQHRAQNVIRDPDKDTLISRRTQPQDWDEMKIAAMNFFDMVNLTFGGDITINNGTTQTVPFRSISYLDRERTDIRRISNFNNDNINGVEFNFNLFLSIPACEVLVGDIEYIIGTMLPETDPIWLADKPNYYTKPQVNALLGAYRKLLPSGTQILIPFTEHLKSVKGVTSLNPQGDEVELGVDVDGNDVVITSNTNFQNYTIIIF
jgi:hypothetical protein